MGLVYSRGAVVMGLVFSWGAAVMVLVSAGVLWVAVIGLVYSRSDVAMDIML